MTEWIRTLFTRFDWECPTFSKSYRTKNILTRFDCKSPTLVNLTELKTCGLFEDSVPANIKHEGA